MDEMMKCGSGRVGGFMELLGFHQHFIPPAPPNFSSSSSSSPISSTSNNSSSISILDHHHHHQGPNDLVTLPQDHDQYSFKDRELINYSNVINYEQQQQQQQQPATPPTISSESCAGDGALTSDACQHTRPLDDHEEQQSRHHPYNPSIPKLKVRKSNEMKNSKGVQKKQQQQHNKEARVAFVTRTEVDHLEDGFRW